LVYLLLITSYLLLFTNFNGPNCINLQPILKFFPFQYPWFSFVCFGNFDCGSGLSGLKTEFYLSYSPACIASGLKAHPLKHLGRSRKFSKISFDKVNKKVGSK
jgi:hypothetical protein